MANIDWVPKWTTTEVIEGGGRFPLALNRFLNGLEDLLIKGIIVQANRLRYISYYCWIIGDINRENPQISYSDFITQFTRRDNALAVGFYLIKPNFGYVGRDNLGSVINQAESDINLDFQILKSNRMGAYGQYYVGTMRTLGLINTNNQGIDTLTDLGEELFNIYEKYLLQFKSKYLDSGKGKQKCTPTVLKEWGEINNLDAIIQPEATGERDFFKKLLFHLDKKQTLDLRRQSLCLFFELINQSSQHSILFTEDEFRVSSFFGSYPWDTDSEFGCTIPDNLNNAFFYWKIYSGHIYFRGWIESYFQLFLEYLKSQEQGGSIDEFFTWLRQEEITQKINSLLKRSDITLETPMSTVLEHIKTAEKLKNPLSIESLYQNESIDEVPDFIAEFVIAMSGLMQHFASIRHDERYKYIQQQRFGDLWFDALFRIPSLQSITIKNFLLFILKEFVIRQHNNVMYEKHDIRRCWFTTEGNRYFHQSDSIPIWGINKFSTIINFLTDLGFVQTNEVVTLTPVAEAFYSKLKKEYIL